MSVPARKILSTFEPARQRRIQEQAAKLIAEETERQRARGATKPLSTDIAPPPLASAGINDDIPN